NQFDAASGFGGYRESGFGREGGKEGLWEYVRSKDETSTDASHASYSTAGGPGSLGAANELPPSEPPIDRTPKLFIGGKQVRPDSGYSLPVRNPDGVLVGEVGDGTRKDIRNAVEAAHAAAGWARQTAHTRAQILYFLAENLESRATEFAVNLDRASASSG